jgi:hypothetical protein
MLGKLGYRSLRGVQISTVFFFTVFIQEWLRYPRAGWTGFALMIIYAGFDNGATILRAYQRFWGMILGLFSGYILWFIGHLDYRLLLFIIPSTVFFAYYLTGSGYKSTVFTINTSLVGTGYFDTSVTLFPVTFFLTDYLMATIIALCIILVCEHFWFNQPKLMHLFIRDIQADMIRRLSRLVHLLHASPIKRSDWFDACIAYTESLFEMQTLAKNVQFVTGTKGSVGIEFNQFLDLNNTIFVYLKALYTARHTKQYAKYDYNLLLDHVRSDLKKLKSLIKEAPDLQQEGVANALDV